jgi:hypothetical protein
MYGGRTACHIQDGEPWLQLHIINDIRGNRDKNYFCQLRIEYVPCLDFQINQEIHRAECRWVTAGD